MSPIWDPETLALSLYRVLRQLNKNNEFFLSNVWLSLFSTCLIRSSNCHRILFFYNNSIFYINFYCLLAICLLVVTCIVILGLKLTTFLGETELLLLIANYMLLTEGVELYLMVLTLVVFRALDGEGEGYFWGERWMTDLLFFMVKFLKTEVWSCCILRWRS